MKRLQIKFVGPLWQRLFDSDLDELFEDMIFGAIMRVGIAGWNHLSPSHREGLVAIQGLKLILTQVDSCPTSAVQELARLVATTAREVAGQDVDENTRIIIGTTV